MFFVLQVLYYVMFVAIIAFFSRISDTRFGGTYITFLNTVTNLGTAWSSTAALGMIDILTFQKCSIDPHNDCSTMDLKEVRSSQHIILQSKSFFQKKCFSYNTYLKIQISFIFSFLFRRFLRQIVLLRLPHSFLRHFSRLCYWSSYCVISFFRHRIIF